MLGTEAPGRTGMTSRDRVLTSLAHKEPDRVPISFGDLVFSSIFDWPPHGYRGLCEYVGVADYPEPISALDDSGAVLNVDERLRRRFGADLRWVMPGSSFEPQMLDGLTVRDEWGLIRHRTGAYWDLVEDEAPLRDASSMRDVERYPNWPSVHDPLIGRGKHEEAHALRAAGYAVVAIPGWAMQIFHNYAFLRGFSRWLLDMYDDPRFYHAFAERLLATDIEYLETFLRPIADVVDLVVLGEDLGTQNSAFMSPTAYRKFCKPYHARWIAAVRGIAPGARVILHTCGAVYPLIPDFIEIGVDVLNPVQPLARQMEPWRLKREFGAELAFLGGLDIQKLLPRGTPDEIRDGARELIDVYGPGGGFIFAPSHQLQADVPPQNIVAMYEAALEHARYPLAQFALPG